MFDYRTVSTINLREIGGMFTNLANKLGHHLARRSGVWYVRTVDSQVVAISIGPIGKTNGK